MSASAHVFEGEIRKPARLAYLLALPDGYDAAPDRRWPLLLFLHGSGERGDDLAMVARHGPLNYAAHTPDFPFIVVAPQCSPSSDWEFETDALNALLDDIIATYRVDQERVYLTGMSMGGRGTWRFATLYTDRFAAIAPVCGRRPNPLRTTPATIAQLAQLPIWMFHGTLDDIVPIEESESMLAALQEHGADVRLTVYPDRDHDAWTPTYANPDLYDWLLTHVRT